jgi:hypothetical protein
MRPENAHKPVTEPALAGFAGADGRFDHPAGWRRNWTAAPVAILPVLPLLRAGRRWPGLIAMPCQVPTAQPWHTIKNLILIGYYTSEVGGSQELQYELVPTRFDPDLPMTSATRAYSERLDGNRLRLIPVPREKRCDTKNLTDRIFPWISTRLWWARASPAAGQPRS